MNFDSMSWLIVMALSLLVFSLFIFLLTKFVGYMKREQNLEIESLKDTLIDKDNKAKPATNSIEDAFTACINRIILPLIEKKDFAPLTKMQLSIVKARNSFSADNYAEIITNINLII